MNFMKKIVSKFERKYHFIYEFLQYENFNKKLLEVLLHPEYNIFKNYNYFMIFCQYIYYLVGNAQRFSKNFIFLASFLT